MKPEQRLFILKIAAGGMVAVMVLYYFIITPAITRWGEQTDRLAVLTANVTKAQKLIDREQTDRAHWAAMMRENLPADTSVAAGQAYQAVGRWLKDSRLIFTSVAPVWKDHQEGYRTYEWQVEATGDQASIGRFLYEMETDSVPVNLEKCEIVTRDARGTQLGLTVHFSFLQLPPK